MPTLSISTDYQDDNTLFKSQLDEIKDGIENFINETKLDQDNIQTGGISAANLATNSVTEQKINPTVAGDGLSGGGGNPLSVNADNSTLEISSDNLRIKDAGVTQAKKAIRSQGSSVSAGGYAVSSGSGVFSTTSSSFVDVTNLSVTITTLGNPVELRLVPDYSGSDPISVSTDLSYIGADGLSTQLAYFRWLRGTDHINQISIQGPNQTGSNQVLVPPGAASMIDLPAAGTYTYKFQASAQSSSGHAFVNRCKLVAYEI